GGNDVLGRGDRAQAYTSIRSDRTGRGASSQASPFRRRFFSGSPLATTMRLRPPLLAWYIAASALAINSSGVPPCAGYSATPMLTVIFPAPNASAATRARMRSATVAPAETQASVG